LQDGLRTQVPAWEVGVQSQTKRDL
jgi:hypothetical protein